MAHWNVHHQLLRPNLYFLFSYLKVICGNPFCVDSFLLCYGVGQNPKLNSQLFQIPSLQPCLQNQNQVIIQIRMNKDKDSYAFILI